MSASRCVSLLAGLILAPYTAFGLPVDNSQAPATTVNPGWAPGYSFGLPPILRRDDDFDQTSEAVCDWTCTHRLLFQTAYSAASSGIEYAMATYNAQTFCFNQETAWCPQIVDSETTAIASKSSFMSINYEACDGACLLAAMNEVSRRGAMYGMQWAEKMFEAEGLGGEEGQVEKLHWTMWFLSQGGASVDRKAMKSAPSEQGEPSNSTDPSQNETTSRNNSTAGNATSSSLRSSHPATNLMTPYLDGSACSDPYLCEEDYKYYISSVLKSASSAVNGTTWLGFMLAGRSESKPTFPAWTTQPPCTRCPPPPDVGPQRPPQDWTPESIPEPPVNPNAPENPTEDVLPEDQPDAEEEARKEKERKEREQKEIEEKCKDDEKCRLDEQKKKDEERKKEEDLEKEDQRKAEEERKAREDRLEKEQEKIDAKCKEDDKCKLDEQQKKEQEQLLEDERKAEEERKLREQQEIDGRCKKDEQCKLEEQRKKDEERKAQEERNRQADEQRKKEVEKEIERKCGGDPKCKEVERANEEARRKLEDKQRKAEEERQRLEDEGHKPCRKKPCPSNPHAQIDPPRPDGELDPVKRYRASLYDPKKGSMQAGDLKFSPTHKDSAFDDAERMPGVSKERARQLASAGYEPFDAMEWGRNTGKTVFHRIGEVVQMDDPSWLRAGDHMFKISNGQIARNALGDPIIGGPSGSPPRVAEPVSRKSVSFDGRTSYKLFDKDGNIVKVGNDKDTFDIKNNYRVSEQMDWKEVNQGRRRLDELQNDLDIADSRWHPTQPTTPQSGNQPGRLGDDRTRPFERPDNGEPDRSDRRKKPGRIDPSRWPPPNVDGADDSDLLDEEGIRKLKNGEKGKLPKPGKYPKVNGMGTITKVARFAQKASTSLIPTGPVGWLVMFGTLGASEFVMFSQAEGDADVWWHCLKERVNIAGVHVCGQIDENGNEIKGEDKGPFINFLDNYYGWLLPSDIDGDGEKENPFEKFVAGMQDLGEQVYDFFDNREDGTGFAENMKTFFVNGVKTIVHAAKKGWNWFEDRVEDVVDFGKKVVHKAKNWIHKAWDWVRGKAHDVDDDDD